MKIEEFQLELRHLIEKGKAYLKDEDISFELKKAALQFTIRTAEKIKPYGKKEK